MNYFDLLPDEIVDYIYKININEWREKMKYVLVDILQFEDIYTLTATLTREKWMEMFITFLEYKNYLYQEDE